MAPAVQDDEDAWETLDAPTSSRATASCETDAVTTRTTPPLQNRKPVFSAQNPRSNSSNDSILTLQRRVETRHKLHRHLVAHPLQIFWSHFLWHLAREFWSLGVPVRLAVLFLALGLGCRVFAIMTWYMWYPRAIFLSLTLLISWVYLYKDDIATRIQGFVDTFINLPHRFPQALERMDLKQARSVGLVCFFVPTLLQARTVTTLADINVSGGSVPWSLAVTVSMSVAVFHLIHPPHSRTPRDLFHICLVILYGSALWINLCQFKIMTLPTLAAPFFLSTATLLLSYQENDSMEWCSAVVRSALRLTLRDVLAGVGTSVQEDEMLQLALLRWLVDYWSYTPPPPQPTTATQPTNQPFPDPTATHTAPAPNQGLQWDDLFPMLEISTDQMSSEVHSLQEQQSAPSGSATAPGGVHNPPAPADSSIQNLHSMLASMNIDDRAKPAVDAYRRNVEELPPTRTVALIVSTLRRCPACLACLWQLLIASTVQPYGTTLGMILMFLPLLVVEVIRIRAWKDACESLSHAFDGNGPTGRSEAPTSQPATTEPQSTTGLFSNILPHVDPMTILLSGDDHVVPSIAATNTNESTTAGTAEWKIPTLLIVWRNVKNSVTALEASLTAARCVQTGAVAVEFAQNVISLAQFGSEIMHHGWMHGLTVIAKEVMIDHGGNINAVPRGSASTVTFSAVSALRNGQRVAHNLAVLAQEDSPVGRMVGPIVGFLGFLGDVFQHMPKGGGNDDASKEDTTTPKEHPNASSQDEEQRASPAPQDSTKEDGDWEATEANVESKQEKANTSETQRETAPHPGAMVAESIIQSAPPVSQKVEKPETVSVESTRIVVEATLKMENAPTTCSGLTAPNQATVLDQPIVHGESSLVQNFTVDPIKMDEPPSILNQSKTITSQGTTEEKETTEELGAVMELVAEAFERSLIDENEKNEFCLKLSTHGKERNFVTAMKATLLGLIQSDCQPEPDAAVDSIQSDTAEAKVPVDLYSSLERTAEQRNAVTKSPMSESGWSPIVAPAESEEATIQSLDSSERLASAEQTREALATPHAAVRERSTSEDDGIPTVASSAPCQSDDDDNVWVKVGSSIAVLGAVVVGGAFLAMHHDNPNNNHRARNENQTNGPGLTIERLDDEEDNGNEWESTSGDRQAQ